MACRCAVAVFSRQDILHAHALREQIDVPSPTPYAKGTQSGAFLRVGGAEANPLALQYTPLA